MKTTSQRKAAKSTKERKLLTLFRQSLFLCVPLCPLRLCVAMFVVNVDFSPVAR